MKPFWWYYAQNVVLKVSNFLELIWNVFDGVPLIMMLISSLTMVLNFSGNLDEQLREASLLRVVYSAEVCPH